MRGYDKMNVLNLRAVLFFFGSHLACSTKHLDKLRAKPIAEQREGRRRSDGQLCLGVGEKG